MTAPTFEAGVRAGLEAAAVLMEQTATDDDLQTNMIRRVREMTRRQRAAAIRSIDPATITPPTAAGEG